MAAHRSAFAEPESPSLASCLQGQHEFAGPSLAATSAEGLLTSNAPSNLRDCAISSQAATPGSAGSQGIRQGKDAAADSAPGQQLVLAHPSEAGQQTGSARVGPPSPRRPNPSSSRIVEEARPASGQRQRASTLDEEQGLAETLCGHAAEVFARHHHHCHVL